MPIIDFLRRLVAPRPINITIVLQLPEPTEPEQLSPSEVAELVYNHTHTKAADLARRSAAAGQTP